MKKIKQHIKDEQFNKVYLLYGEERYLVRLYKKLLKDAICQEESMNYSYYEGKDISVNEIKDVAMTLPFFADRRLIIVENSGFFKNSSDGVAEIIKHLPDTTFMVFVESEVDKRNKVYKTVNDVGYVCEMKTQTEEDLRKWTLKIFSDAGMKITGNNMNLFLGITGLNMDNIYNEAMKLVAYCIPRDVIKEEDIREVCSTTTEDRVFDMIEAMALKKKDEAMKLYGDLLALKEPPMKILALMGKHFSQLLAVKKLCNEGRGGSDIAGRLGIRPYFVGKYISQAKGYSEKALLEAVNDCADADYRIKSGQTEDKYALDILIVKYSR